MKRHEKRVHIELSTGHCASVFINPIHLRKPTLFKDCTESFTTDNYEYIGTCVTKDKKTANDWWSKHSYMTLNLESLNKEGVSVIKQLLSNHALEVLNKKGYYCFVIEPEDDKRRIEFMRNISKFCKKNSLTYTYVIHDFTALMYMVK